MPSMVGRMLGHYRMGAQVFVDTPEKYAEFEKEYAPVVEEAPAEPAPGDAATEGGAQ